MIQIFFGISDWVQRSKVDFQLADEFQPTKHPFFKCLRVVDGGFKPVKCCSLKIEQGIVDLAFIVSIGNSTSSEVEVALGQKDLEVFGISPIKHVRFLDLGLFLQSWMLNGFHEMEESCFFVRHIASLRGIIIRGVIIMWVVRRVISGGTIIITPATTSTTATTTSLVIIITTSVLQGEELQCVLTVGLEKGGSAEPAA